MKLLTYTESNYEIAIERELGKLILSVRVGRRRKRSDVELRAPRHPVPQAVADVLAKAGLDPDRYFHFSGQALRIGALPAIHRFVAVSIRTASGRLSATLATDPAGSTPPLLRREDVYRLAQSYAKADVPARSEVGMRALRLLFNGATAEEAHSLLTEFKVAPQGAI